MPKNNITLKIEGLSSKGEGFAKIGEDKFYFPFTLQGDEVKAVLEEGKISGQYEIIKSAKERQKPICKHFEECGGCLLQHLNEAEYKKFKYEKAITAIRKAGFENDIEISFAPHFSRRKATVKFSEGKVGFYRRDSHEVIDLEECFVTDKDIFELIKKLKNFNQNILENFKQLSITKADSGLDVFIEIKEELSAEELNKITEFAKTNNINRVSIKIADKNRVVFESSKVSMNYGGFEVNMPSEYFLQPTQFGQNEITEFVIRNIKSAKKIVDLFSGAGTYSFPLSKFAKVHAVEGSEEMVSSFKSQKNITSEKRDLDRAALTPRELSAYDAAVINPPRTGALNQSKNLARSSVNRVVMVSCNPITFARDAKFFNEAGFRLKKAKAIDQFLWTEHLEIVAYFERD